MRVRSVVVAHREPLAAEGIAAALASYPTLLLVGVASTAAEAERQADRADVLAMDERLAGADETASRLRRRGVRVVMLGGGRPPADGPDGIRIPPDASVAHLAAALVPGAQDVGRRVHTLSTREQEVLALVAKGLPGKQVARHLGISPKTVEQHKTRIFAKLGVRNQAAAVALTVARGVISWSPSTT